MSAQPSPSRQLAAAHHEALRDALKRAASALRAADLSFALAGSYALWVYGAPEPEHDVDLVVAEPDTEAAAVTLAAAGFEVTRTPEDWLFKAATHGAVVDVLHRVNGTPVTADLVAAAEVHQVLAIVMPVLSPTVVMAQKLKALNEHHCDFAHILPATRAVRERIDWDHLREETSGNAFATAFLFLVRQLNIAPPDRWSAG